MARVSQIRPAIQAILDWMPGEPFPEGIGAKVPELDVSTLAIIPGSPEALADLDDYGETLEPSAPSDLAGFLDLDGTFNHTSEKLGSAGESGGMAVKKGVSADDL